MNRLEVAPGIDLYHVGPPLDLGPLPSVFYFAVSGQDSLGLDPFNQPVQFLQGKMIRVFSMTLPGHEDPLHYTKTMALWAQDITCIDKFLDEAERAVDFAMNQRFVDPEKMCAAGLSRGAFIAAHLAARKERFRFLLGFAPLTRLGKLKEFAHLPEVQRFDLVNLAESLSDRHVRLYIGNHDTRVGTRDCFEFAMSLVNKSHPQVELFITPSIGRMGHGTSPEIFNQGAEWIGSIFS